MTKIGEQLYSVYKALIIIILLEVVLVLFFLWFPDFIGWLSIKRALITEGTIIYNVLGVIPLSLVIGVIFTVVAVSMAAALEIETVNKLGVEEVG